MGNFDVYVPIKGVSYTNKKGNGYTCKGKKYVSYTVNKDGKKISTWILEAGGIEMVVKTIKELIVLNYDFLPISKILNISPVTCSNFISRNLSQYYIEKEKENFKNNSKIRRKINSKGISKKTKGKKYIEIYGTHNPVCGFKKGDKNPNFTRDKYTGCRCISSSGKKFRSSYEVRFSEILERNNISYNYEHQFKLINGRVKVVDFIIKNKLIEVTGYAYEKWKRDFDIKINLLDQTYKNKEIIIVSTSDNIAELKEKHGSYAKILNLDNEDEIISALAL